MEPTINYLAVLVAGIAGMAVGVLWYSKLLFGRVWARLKGHTDESLREAQKSLGKLYGLSFLLSLLTSYLLAHVVDLSLNFYKGSAMQSALASAFFMWLGFVIPVQFTGQMFGEKKWKLFLVDTGYQLAWLLAAGVVIGLLR